MQERVQALTLRELCAVGLQLNARVHVPDYLSSSHGPVFWFLIKPMTDRILMILQNPERGCFLRLQMIMREGSGLWLLFFSVKSSKVHRALSSIATPLLCGTFNSVVDVGSGIRDVSLNWASKLKFEVMVGKGKEAWKPGVFWSRINNCMGKIRLSLTD